MKLLLSPLLLLACCLVAAVYGAVHNQVTYTVSPDYFLAFKFLQFGIAPELQNRFGASFVGVLASWWMGLVIGVPILIAGLGLKGPAAYARHIAVAACLVTAVTLLVGLLALAWNFADPGPLPSWTTRLGLEAEQRRPFGQALAMHNASYLGGLLGLLAGCLYMIAATIVQRRRRALATD